MNDLVMLVFILEYGSFMKVLLPKTEAHRIIGEWSSGLLDGFISVKNPPPHLGCWGVRASAVRGMHTEALPAQVQHSPYYYGPKTSGN